MVFRKFLQNFFVFLHNAQKFCDFYKKTRKILLYLSVFVCILVYFFGMTQNERKRLNTLNYDDDGEYFHRFVGVRTSHNENRMNVFISSRNQPPRSASRLALNVRRSCLIIIKKYCIIFIESEKRTLSKNNFF